MLRAVPGLQAFEEPTLSSSINSMDQRDSVAVRYDDITKQFDLIEGKLDVASICRYFNLNFNTIEINGRVVSVDASGLMRRPIPGGIEEVVVSGLPQAGVAYQRFVSFLDPPVDEAVLDRVVIHYPSSLLAVGTKQQAEQLYNKAASLPGTSTKLNAQQQHGLSINGDFLPNVATKSTLVYAFLDTKPMLLKVPASDQAADLEAGVWTTLSQHGTPSHLAGPIQLHELQGSRRTRKGILMPLYPVTMQHMPHLTESNALQLGQQLLTALKHMHSFDLAHCDIKAPNVFIDADGDAHLGDFGATRSIGAAADEKTPSHVPVDAGGKLDVDKASPALDFFLLAVTLMERLGWLQLGRRQLTMSMVADSMNKATSESLRDFLLLLLPCCDEAASCAAE